MAITQRTIDIETPAAAGFACYLAVPAEGHGPGLLLLHDSHGVNDQAKHLANVLAEEGWVVAVPDLYWRLGRKLCFDYAADGRAAALATAARFDNDHGVHDAGVALAALKALPECDGEAGVVGHDLGGRVALLLAARDHGLACAVSYDPTELENYVGVASQIRCPALCHFASGSAVAAAAIAPLRSALTANDSIKVYTYAGVEPGFDRASSGSFDRSAHWLARSRTLELLRRKLGPVYDIANLWDQHLYSEFVDRNVEVSMATMVDEPYVLVVPTVTGGTGKPDLHRWYSNHFHFQNPEDTRIISISRTVGADRIVDEFIFCFTHDCIMDWLLPGVAPTGKYIEIPMIAVVNFRGSLLYHEHIWWDQATVLVQAGLLDPRGLPVTGIEQSKAMQNEMLPRNRLIAGWA